MPTISTQSPSLLTKPAIRKPGHEIDFDLLKNKFISKNGKIMGCGLTIFPK
jgi:hypothetical protein